MINIYISLIILITNTIIYHILHIQLKNKKIHKKMPSSPTAINDKKLLTNTSFNHKSLYKTISAQAYPINRNY